MNRLFDVRCRSEDGTILSHLLCLNPRGLAVSSPIMYRRVVGQQALSIDLCLFWKGINDAWLAKHLRRQAREAPKSFDESNSWSGCSSR